MAKKIKLGYENVNIFSSVYNSGNTGCLEFYDLLEFNKHGEQKKLATITFDSIESLNVLREHIDYIRLGMTKGSVKATIGVEDEEKLWYPDTETWTECCTRHLPRDLENYEQIFVLFEDERLGKRYLKMCVNAGDVDWKRVVAYRKP